MVTAPNPSPSASSRAASRILRRLNARCLTKPTTFLGIAGTGVDYLAVYDYDVIPSTYGVLEGHGGVAGTEEQ